MYYSKTHNKIEIRIENEDNLFDLNLCAKEFLDLIEDFKEKFLNKEFFILSAYFDKILAALLIAEDNTQKIDSLEKIIPNINIHLVYVNPKFRKKGIGKKLLQYFIFFQKSNGIASIYVKLPQKYKLGINFFLKNNFQMIQKINHEIILELALWKDYGVRECHIIGENFNDMFY